MQTEFENPAKPILLKPNAKRKYFWSAKHRRYVRYPCAWQVRFWELSRKGRSACQIGKCKNLSEGGMKISALQALERNTIILLEADLNLISKHISIKNLLMVEEKRILTEVRWRHLNLETRLFEAGLRFLTEDERSQYQTSIDLACQI